jgi:hypothetical protein
MLLSKLDILEQAPPPCVVFFKLKEDRIEQVAIAQLDHTNLIHGFHELYGVIERYIKTDANEAGFGSRSLKWLKSSSGFVALGVFRAALKMALDLIR